MTVNECEWIWKSENNNSIAIYKSHLILLHFRNIVLFIFKFNKMLQQWGLRMKQICLYLNKILPLLKIVTQNAYTHIGTNEYNVINDYT